MITRKLLLAIPVLLILMSAAAATIDPEGSTWLIAPDDTAVWLYRDDYGVPHLVGESEVGVAYGQGFAVARDRLYQMEINRRYAEGRLAELFGPAYVGLDKQTRRLGYTQAEREAQFLELPADLQTLIASYVTGINTYLDSMMVNPGDYRPLDLAGIEVEPWTRTNVVAVMQFLARQFGQFGGQELVRLQELENLGQGWFDQNRPINDPTAPTTIPDGGRAQGDRVWRDSGKTVRSEVIDRIETRRTEFERIKRDLGLPPKFGSFAVQIGTAKSATGNVMLLGCPQMGEPQVNETNVTHEVEMECPTLHVGGMAVAGIPLVIIGHNEDYVWTLTSGISDNTDVYIETTFDASYSSYWHNGTWVPFEAIPDTVRDVNGGEWPHTIYRTMHGPVFGDDLANHQVFTYKMAFWDRELDMIPGFYDIASGQSLNDFEAALAQLPMSFNVFYAGRDQSIKYWHTGWYQDRTDGVDPRLPHDGDGSEEWGGIRPFASLPADLNPTQDYFVNWNNKPVVWWDNGDNVPWVGGHPVTMIDGYVEPISSFSYEDLKETPHEIFSHGTYQQAVEFGTGVINDENIIPPGQSAFVGLDGQPSPHLTDQWTLHLAWDYKDMLFGQTPVAVDPLESAGARAAPHRNTPNPFRPHTEISFIVPAEGRVSLVVFDAMGRRVRELLDARLPTGPRSVVWDGRSDRGEAVAPGAYFYHLIHNGKTLSGKMIRIE